MSIKITSCLIKELRSRTGAGFLECKRALSEENGNIEKSIDNLRKSGKTSAEKKINNTTKQGVIASKIQSNIGVMIELNCETDFVSKDHLFTLFAQDILSTAILQKITDLHNLKNIFEDKRIELVSKFGENINIRRFSCIYGENIFSYIHGVRIGVLVDANQNLNKIILKNIAMHIAASNPQYLYSKDISKEILQREYKIQLELTKNLKKPSHVLNKIIEGKMNKFSNNISLMSQIFIMENNKTVGDILKEHNGCIKSFIRFELGEIIF